MSRNKSIHFRIDGTSMTFDQLKAQAEKRCADQIGDFWSRTALILLSRIYDLEREAQQLRQGELFAPPPIAAEVGGEA